MNIGRCLRDLSARSTAPRPMIGSVLAVQLTTMSNSASRAGQVGQPHRLAAEARGQLLAAFERAVGDGDGLRLLGREVRGREVDHLAGADEQHARLAQVLEQLARPGARRRRPC